MIGEFVSPVVPAVAALSFDVLESQAEPPPQAAGEERPMHGAVLTRTRSYQVPVLSTA